MNVRTRTVGNTYVRECYSAIKKSENMPSAAMWMDPETDTLRELRKGEKSIYSMTSLICGIQKEIIQINIFTKPSQTHRYPE